MIDLIQEKELIENRLDNLMHGSIEIRERNEHKYIYVNYRDVGIKRSKYAGVYSPELQNTIIENNKLAKQYKRRLREINKILDELGYSESSLNEKIKLNIDVARKNLADSIYKQARLEGILTTYADTETIIAGGKVKNMHIDDVMKIVNLKRAWNFILNEYVITHPTDYNILRQINGIVDDGFSYTAGQIRPVPVKIGGSTYLPPIPIETKVIEDINNIVNSSISVADKTIELLLYVTKSQIFIDGNKRTAVIFANHYLISQGGGLIIIPEEVVTEYVKHLLNYYENKNDKIKNFLKEKCLMLF
ncbi:MAG TPA: Fic family protein [Bacilli bacterium]|nr:Fic family protein [Bacilli bacterium]